MVTFASSSVITIPVQLDPIELQRLNVPLLGAISKWSTPDELLKWNANFGGAGAVGESVNASVSTFTSDAVDQASLTIGSYRLRSSFTIHEVKYSQAIARGQDALANLIEYSSMGARRELIQLLGRKIITGTGVAGDGGIVGINAINSTSTAVTTGKEKSDNAYAGIDPDNAGYEKWTSLVYTNVGTLTKKKLNDFVADMVSGTTTGVPSSYNALLMSPMTANKYTEVFDSSVQINVSPVSNVDLGTGNLTFNGRPIIQDPGLTDGEIHFVDTNALRLYSFNQAAAPGMSEEEPMDGILMYSKMLPSDNPQLLKFSIYLMAQVQLRDRSVHNILRGITV